jgi:hypothetical protein
MGGLGKSEDWRGKKGNQIKHKAIMNARKNVIVFNKIIAVLSFSNVVLSP